MRFTDAEMAGMSDAELEAQDLWRIPFLFVPHGQQPDPAWVAAHPGTISFPATLTLHRDRTAASRVSFDMADAITRVAASMGVTLPRQADSRPTSVALAQDGSSGGVAIDIAPQPPRIPGPQGAQYAQATDGTTISDAAPPGRPAAPPGRYVAAKPVQWIGQPSVGTGECVPLVQAATGAPRSSQWKRGVKVQGNMSIRPGTAIATFDMDGNYAGHAAIYLGQNARGIQVVDQWNIFRNRVIVGKRAPNDRTLWFGRPEIDMVDQGENYHVVE